MPECIARQANRFGKRARSIGEDAGPHRSTKTRTHPSAKGQAAEGMGHPPRRSRGGYWAGAGLDSGLVNLPLSTGAVSTFSTRVVMRASGRVVVRTRNANLMPLPMSR